MRGPCNERGEQLLLFVLDALDAAEHEAFTAHLADCEHCANAVRAARVVLEEKAPPELRRDADSLDRVRLRLQRRVRGALPLTAAPPTSRAPVLRAAALAAGVAAALVGAGGWLLHHRDLAQLEQTRRTLEQRRIAIEQEVSGLTSQRDEIDARLALARREVDLLRAENLVIVPLEAVSASSDARARIFWHPPTLRCYILARGLPPLGDGRRYALWVFTASGNTILVGSFSADASGRGDLYAELPATATERIDRVVVTDEPAQVGAAPTGAEHLIWTRPV